MHILLVDDNPLMQQVISCFLDSQGYSVLIAHNASAARQLAQQNHCNLFLVDLRLPDDDGPSLLIDLRHLPGYAACPSIAISGMGDNYHDRTIAEGFDAFLSKPVDLDDLLHTVQRCLGLPTTQALSA